MNRLLICVVGLFSVILGISKCTPSMSVRSPYTQVPIEFGYRLKDYLYMMVNLYRRKPGVATYMSYQTDEGDMGTKAELELKGKLDSFVVTKQLLEQQIFIDLDLYTKDGWCDTIKLAKGSVLPPDIVTVYEYYRKYSYNCTTEINPCLIELLLNEKCNDTQVVCSKGRCFPSNTSTVSDNISDNRTTRGTSQTANVTDINKDHNEVIVRDSVIIVSSLSALSLILFGIIVTMKRCWIKRKRQRPPQPLPTNIDPFYLNLLFRRECDQEIEEIEQHHYEEI